MRKMEKGIIIVFFAVLITGCNSNTQTKKVEPAMQKADTINKAMAQEDYEAGTTDEAVAAKIRNYLIQDYLKDDLNAMKESDRKFQFQTVDLNNDGNQELFINFIGSYFCGSGGCTLLLLDHKWGIITQFTVTSTPIMIEPHEGKGWAMLMVMDDGVWKELNYKNGKYPGNPSLLPKSRFDAPSGHAQAVFSEEFGRAKTFSF